MGSHIAMLGHLAGMSRGDVEAQLWDAAIRMRIPNFISQTMLGFIDISTCAK